MLVIYDLKFSTADFLFTEFYLTPGYSTDSIFQHVSLITVNFGSCYGGSFMLMTCSYHSEHDTGLPSIDSGEYYLTLAMPVETVMEVH